MIHRTSIPSRALMLRHAPTPWNAARRWQGSGSDLALTDEGTRLVRTARSKIIPLLTAPRVWSSPLHRCVETAALLADGWKPAVEVVVLSELREFAAGDLEGKTEAEIAEGWPVLHAAWRRGEVISCPGGEDASSLMERVRSVQRLIDEAVVDGDLLIISHLGVIRGIRALNNVVPIREDGYLEGLRGSFCSAKIAWRNFGLTDGRM